MKSSHRLFIFLAQKGVFVPPVPVAPDAFTAGQWSLTPGDLRYTIVINSLPNGGSAGISDIEYREDGGTWTSLNTLTTGSFPITGKTNGIEYDVELRAVSAVGPAAASDLKSVTPVSGDTVPDTFVIGDWDADRGNQQIAITINSLPFDGGAAITDVEYRLDGGSWVSSGGTVSFNITSLTNGVTYDVELRAVNVEGASATSDVKSATPATTPSTFVAGDWTLTAGDEEYTINVVTLPSNGGSSITAIEYREDGGTWTALTGTGTGERIIGGKTNAVEYDVELRQVNSVGASAASDLKSVTPEAPPSIPTWLTDLDPDAVMGWDFRDNSVHGLTSNFVRASEALMKDAAGDWQVFASNTLRRTETIGARFETARTNKITWKNANPTDLTGMTKSGNASSTLTVVDSGHADFAAVQAVIAASELDAVVGDVYCLDNNLGGSGSAFVNMTTTVGNTNPHVTELWAWGPGGNYKIWDQLVGATGYIAIPSALTRRSVAITPTSSANFQQIGVQLGGKLFFILGQTFEGTLTTLSPVRTDGGSPAAQAADALDLIPDVAGTYDWHALYDDDTTHLFAAAEVDTLSLNPASLNRSIMKAVYAVPFEEGGGGGGETFSPTFHIGPTSAGNGSGSSWANRATLASINSGITAGGLIAIATDLGTYSQTSGITISQSGTALNPCRIIGLNSADNTLGDRQAGKIVGSRTSWTSPASFSPADVSGWNHGNTLFDLNSRFGLQFRNLWFERFQNTFVITSGHDIELMDCMWYNTRNNWFSGSGSSSYNIRFIRPDAIGFSRDGIRMHGTSHDYYVEDVQADSRWQDKDAHARYVYRNDTAHHFEIHTGVNRTGFIKNCYYSTKDGNGFRQGEGMSSETFNHHLIVRGEPDDYFVISGCTDAAFDIKEDDVLIQYVDCVANKRSFRMWGDRVDILDCKSRNVQIYPSFGGDENGYILHTWAGCPAGQDCHINYERLLIEGGPSGVNLFNGYSVGFQSGSSVTSTQTQYLDLPGSYVLTSGAGWVFSVSPSP